jgi:hypothetical protein
VLVTDYPGNVRLFPTDTDGQSASAATIAQNYGLTNAVGLGQVGKTIYMTQQGNGTVVQLNPNGTYNGYVAGNIYQATGIVADPANGHLIVSTSGSGHNQVFDVDPATGSAKLLINSSVDGLTITADGKMLYAAAGDRVLGYDVRTGALVYQSALIPGTPDGIALGTGILAGNLFVNTHAGTLLELNLATDALTTIAEGGSRGDFAIADPNNGSLLLTQSDRVLRLTAPPGGGFGLGAPPNAAPLVPEPSALALIAVGIGALAVLQRRRGSAINNHFHGEPSRGR